MCFCCCICDVHFEVIKHNGEQCFGSEIWLTLQRTKAPMRHGEAAGSNGTVDEHQWHATPIYHLCQIHCWDFIALLLQPGDGIDNNSHLLHHTPNSLSLVRAKEGSREDPLLPFLGSTPVHTVFWKDKETGVGRNRRTRRRDWWSQSCCWYGLTVIFFGGGKHGVGKVRGWNLMKEGLVAGCAGVGKLERNLTTPLRVEKDLM